MPPWQPAIPFHITLVPPFNTTLPLQDIALRVEPIAAATPSFPVALDGLGRFDHATSILYVGVTPDERLAGFAQQLRDALAGITPGHYDEGRFPFTPHVTLAGKVSRMAIDEYLRQVANETVHQQFDCDRVALLELDENARKWHNVREFILT